MAASLKKVDTSVMVMLSFNHSVSFKVYHALMDDLLPTGPISTVKSTQLGKVHISLG